MTRAEDLPELSRSELDLMRILWKERRLSAREVHDRLGDGYDWAYSTTRTMLERMVGKGYLERASFHGVNLYRPLISRPQGLAQLVRDFAERVLEGDQGSVVALFATSSSLSEEEISELAGLVEGDASEPTGLEDAEPEPGTDGHREVAR